MALATPTAPATPLHTSLATTTTLATHNDGNNDVTNTPQLWHCNAQRRPTHGGNGTAYGDGHSCAALVADRPTAQHHNT